MKSTARALTMIGFAALALSASAEQSIVVAPFLPPAGSDYSWRPIGERARAMMQQELTKAKYTVLERANFDDLEKEDLMALWGQTKSADQAGLRLSGDVMIMGSLSSVDITQQKIAILTINTVKVDIDARAIDMRSGKVLGYYTGHGEEKAVGVDLGSLGSILGSGGNASIEKAIRKAACKAVAEMPKEFPISAAPAQTNTAAQAAPSNGEYKKLRYMVLLPETHLSRPRVPDPAGETAIKKALIDEGLSVYDADRLAELREEQWVREAYRGTLSSAEMASIRNRYGVDVLITGEGISERAEQAPANGFVVCRGRIEIKAILLETGQLLFADAKQDPGRDASEIMASKQALGNAGAEVAQGLLNGLRQYKGNNGGPGLDTLTLDLEISGWEGLTQALRFLEAAKHLAGVTDAAKREYRDGVLYGTITLKKATMDDIFVKMESDSSMAGFKFHIEAANDKTLRGAVKK